MGFGAKKKAITSVVAFFTSAIFQRKALENSGKIRGYSLKNIFPCDANGKLSYFRQGNAIILTSAES